MEENIKDRNIVFSEKYVDEQLKSINAMLTERNYSLSKNIQALNSDINRPRQISRSNIRRAVTNPYANVDTLQQASMLLKATNGIYKRLLNYHSKMLMNDYIIYPLNADKIKTPEKMQKAYYEMATWIERFNVKDTTSWITERVLEQGELYLYKIEDSNGILLQEIPNNYCKVTSRINDTILLYGVDLTKLNDNNILAFPNELQLVYKKFKNGSLKKDKLIDGKYYELTKNAIAFNMDRNSSKGVPFYCTIFDDLMELEDMKDLKSENAVIESIKLIHQKLPIDKDTGQVLMDFSVASQYHQATKSNLPKGTCITTNPLDLQALVLSDNSNKIGTYVAQSLNNIYDTAGINTELFNGDKSSNQAIINGIVADTFIAKAIQQMVQNWLNYELSLNKKNGTAWGLRFLGNTEFNKDEVAKANREDMAYGGSRLEYLASKGYTPLQGLSVFKMESMLGLDQLLVPQATSHTQSGDVDNESGRPEEVNSDNDTEANV